MRHRLALQAVPLQDQPAEQYLREQLRGLRRRKWIVFFSALVVTSAATAAALLQTPMYRTSAEVLLQQRSSESLFGPNTGAAGDSIGTELVFLTSPAVQDRVRQQIGIVLPVTPSQVSGTNVVSIEAVSSDPVLAAKVVNAYTHAYVEVRKEREIDDLLAGEQVIQKKIDDLQGQIAGYDAQLAGLAASQKQGTGADLQAKRDAVVVQQAGYKQQLDQLQLAASLKTGGASVVTTATPPVRPFKPTPLVTGIKGLVVGVIFGVALAALLEFLDDSIKTKDEVERVAPDLPMLALVPPVPSWKDRSKPVVVSLTEPTSVRAEAYRTLRTSVQFMSLDRPMRTIQVTSPLAREGKTTTAANLGVALARAGQRVVILDCDLRKPRLATFFELENERGFTSVLLGDCPLSAALQRVRDVPNLAILSAGPLPPNPSELLSGRRTVEVLVALQATADVVIIDSPPLLPVTDAVVLSGRVDATIVVATAGTTTRRQLHRALEILQQVDAPVVGTVLNRASVDGSYGYYSGYGYNAYGYGGGKAADKRAKRGQETATKG